jgi:hypothetical protein
MWHLGLRLVGETEERFATVSMFVYELAPVLSTSALLDSVVMF